jgi:O-antigen/teichoic acid export membrane protein
MGAKVGRDSLFYSVVSGVVFPLAFLNALVLTHFLSTAQYGQLSVLFTVSGLFTVILNLVYLRGAERMVWGSSDEGLDLDAAQLIESHLRPRALGTAVILSWLLAAITVAAVVPVATPISKALLNTPHLHTAVIWSAVSAGLGAVYRLTWNIVRWERRHVAYGTVYALRPVMALIIAWPLVALGMGVAGAMAATAIGTFLSCLFGLAIARKSYSITLNRHDLVQIIKSSGPMATLMVGIYLLHNGDVVLLSRYASASQVGIYRLAGNLTSVVSYVVSAFLMAWAPLEHSSLFQAAYERHGRDRMRGEFIVYYMIVSLFCTVVMSAAATPLVSLFSQRYFRAEAFVAITSLGWVAYGLFIVIGRSSTFPKRYVWYGIAALASVVGLIGTGMLLGPSLGGYGVAIGDVVGGVLGGAIVLIVAARGGETPSVSLRRILVLVAISGACYAIGSPLAAAVPGLQVELKVLSVALYPALLLALRVIPAYQLEGLWSIVRNALRSRARPEALIERVATLPTLERRAILTIARDGEPASRVTALTGVPTPTVERRFVHALRKLADAGEPGDHDLTIADYLLTSRSVTMREGIARELWEVVSPVELHQIETAFDALRNAPPKAWSKTVVHGGQDLPPAPWPLDTTAMKLLDGVVREGRRRAEVAREAGLTEPQADRRLVGALRTLSTGQGSSPADGLIASFLFERADAPPARQLWAAGVDPIELHQLELVAAEIRSLAGEEWAELRTGAAPLALPAGQEATSTGVAELPPAAIASADLDPV